MNGYGVLVEGGCTGLNEVILRLAARQSTLVVLSPAHRRLCVNESCQACIERPMVFIAGDSSTAVVPVFRLAWRGRCDGEALMRFRHLNGV